MYDNLNLSKRIQDRVPIDSSLSPMHEKDHQKWMFKILLPDNKTGRREQSYLAIIEQKEKKAN